MNLDERLPGLLASEAEHADAAPPTREGVETVIGRRARHRKRQRRVGTGLAALCVVAGVAGGLALAGGDEPPVDSTDGPVLPDVPLLGVDVSGLTLTDAEHGPLGENSTDAQFVYAVFTEPSGSPTGPVITAGIDPGIEPFEPLDREDGVPVDLDGDTAADGPEDGRILTTDGGTSLIWLTADGRRAGVGGTGITEEDLLAYVGGLDRAALDVRTMPAPDGLTHRELVTIPSYIGADEASTQYEGLGGSMVVLVTNSPGWFDLTRTGVIYDSDGAPEEIALGPSLLGPGTALVGDDQNTTTAVAQTESGLAVQITAFDLAPDVVRDILADGRFVEVEPTDEPTTPPTTTAVAPVTTVPADPQTTTSIPTAPSVMPIDVTLEPGDELDRVEIFFAGANPGHELTAATEPFGGDCGPAPTDGESYLTLRLDVPLREGDERWPGIDLVAPDANGKVRSIWSCGWFEGAVYISIALDAPREPESYRGFGQPVLIIDIPR